MIKELTAEEIDHDYTSAMSSVNLINNGQPAHMDDEDWAITLKSNKEHLEIMVAKTFWTDEDMTPFIDAINS